MYSPDKPYIERILSSVSGTWNTQALTVQRPKGSVYPIITRQDLPKNYGIKAHKDGVGTKAAYHLQHMNFGGFVQDALGMTLNDMLLSRARTFKVADYLMLPKDDPETILKIVSCLAAECRKRDIAIVAGETAIHEGREPELVLYGEGYILSPKPNLVLEGDYLIGVKSSGLHSNGFTKVREVFGTEFREDFIIPTIIYSDCLESLVCSENSPVNGIMHITGGAFTKLRGIIPDGLGAYINRAHGLKPQEIFHEIHARGVSDREMYKTFNCGIGLVLSCSQEDSAKVLQDISSHGLESWIIGKVVKSTRKVVLESQFSSETLLF